MSEPTHEFTFKECSVLYRACDAAISFWQCEADECQADNNQEELATAQAHVEEFRGMHGHLDTVLAIFRSKFRREYDQKG